MQNNFVSNLLATFAQTFADNFCGPQKRDRVRLENFPSLKSREFSIFHARAHTEYAEQRKTDVKEKNLFFFSFTESANFKVNFFSIKC